MGFRNVLADKRERLEYEHRYMLQRVQDWIRQGQTTRPITINESSLERGTITVKTEREARKYLNDVSNAIEAIRALERLMGPSLVTAGV